MAGVASDRDMFAALTTLEDPDTDLHNAFEAVDALHTTDTDGDEEMTDRMEAATSDLPGAKLQAADPRETRAASVSQDSTDICAVSMVSPSDLTRFGPDLPHNNKLSAPVLRQSRFCRVRATLTSIYGDKTRHNLTPEGIEQIIKLGDSFLRVDIRSFLESFRHACPADGLWNRQPLSNSTSSQTRIEKLFNGVRCADVLERDLAVDPLRLRMARIIFYQHFEQLCIDLGSNEKLRGRLSPGRDRKSVATDAIVKDLYDLDQKVQVDGGTLKSYRGRVHKHKRIGKRWCMLASHLGLGVLLLCHRDIEIQM
jgi:hypothetical protein